ncbi:Protein kinase superfamily protein [Zea mays]|uniref:Protein kinase superfamily protein n=1 Tax=Zea mays TaxID=4577 RepID=A0A1D6FNK8_MAIZE|nr:Protein kinase superfamily protein [Zea mays]AQK93240.1 Protein kinase superfamily protein [Zea mays]AQK93243.1 Protein kinase superfamily protein [Zea mays]
MTDGDDEYKREESVALLVIVFLAALSLLSVIAAFAYYCYITRKVSRRLQAFHIPKRSSSHHTLPPRALPPQQQGTDNPSSNSTRDGVGAAAMSVVAAGERGVQVFSYRQLHAATGGFDRAHMVGQGSFGTVYRGVLPDGRKVAVKLMDRPGKQGEDEFEMEVELLSRLRSPYLLGLIGHCSEGEHCLLVYEFMANGGLQEHLYPNRGIAILYCPNLLLFCADVIF